jgi:hypothetical protein
MLDASGRLTEMAKAARLARCSITTSARASSVGGTSMPSALAVFRLTASSNLAGSSGGQRVGALQDTVHVACSAPERSGTLAP